MKQYSSETDNKKTWIYFLRVTIGAVVFWLLGYFVYVFAVI